MTVSRDDAVTFDPDATTAMALAFDYVCDALQIPADLEADRRRLASRIVELARSGVLDATALRDRILEESNHIHSGQEA